MAELPVLKETSAEENTNYKEKATILEMVAFLHM